MGDTSETNTKVLSRELFLGVVALKTPIPQNHYLRDKVPFLKSGHTLRAAFDDPLPDCLIVNCSLEGHQHVGGSSALLSS